MRRILTVALALFIGTTPAIAQERELIGTGRLFTNDYFGDKDDRWRSGSFVYSHVRGFGPYSGTEAMGDILEFRFRSEIIAPDAGTPAPGDRPYVGVTSLGAHTHFQYGTAEVSLGVDVQAIGPQTGLSDFQNDFHDAFDMPNAPHTDQQLEDRFFLNGTASATWRYDLGESVQFRPFAEGLAGSEDLLRVGADFVVGPFGQDRLLLRDVVTGQLYSGTSKTAVGPSYVIGADIASVFDSDFLPAERGYDVVETRGRARAGMHWQFGNRASVFYGATYLSPEFEGQPEGQVVGSLKLNFNF